MKKLLVTLVCIALTCFTVCAESYNEMTIGHYEQDGDVESGPEPIEWLIVDENDDAYLCIAKYAIDNVPYHNSAEAIDWEDSDLRRWLNGEFMEAAFSEDERARILPVDLSNYANPDHGTSSGPGTTDSVFLLDVQETNRYFPTAEERVALPTELVKGKGIISVHDNVLWRLRTSGRDEEHAVIVLTTGEYDYCGLNVNYDLAAIRPAMWVAK